MTLFSTRNPLPGLPIRGDRPAEDPTPSLDTPSDVARLGGGLEREGGGRRDIDSFWNAEYRGLGAPLPYSFGELSPLPHGVGDPVGLGIGLEFEYMRLPPGVRGAMIPSGSRDDWRPRRREGRRDMSGPAIF